MTAYIRRVKQPARPISSRFGQLDLELTERCNIQQPSLLQS